MAKGYISIHRQIKESWLWEEKPFSRGQAWVDLLLMVNHEDKKVFFKSELLSVKRGETVTSIRKLCDAWGWSNTKVKTFLDVLESDNMIKHKSDTKRTVITILKYNSFQDKKDITNDTETTQKRHRNDTNQSQKHTNNNDNNDNKEESINNSTGGFQPPVPPETVAGFNYLKDGRSYIEPTVFFKKEHFNGLPQENILAITSFFKTTKKVDVLDEDVKSLWSIFKIQELTEQKPYRNEADVYRHFLNWCKKQSFSKPSIQRTPKKAETIEKKGLNLQNLADRYDD